MTKGTMAVKPEDIKDRLIRWRQRTFCPLFCLEEGPWHSCLSLFGVPLSLRDFIGLFSWHCPVPD